MLVHLSLCLSPYKVRPPNKSAYWKTILFISRPKHMLWVPKEPSKDGSFEHTKHMFKLMGKEIITDLRS